MVRDNLYVYRRDGEGERMEFTFMDADLPAGEHYYYVRVEQVDGHVAWASPIWVDDPLPGSEDVADGDLCVWLQYGMRNHAPSGQVNNRFL